MKLVSVIVNCFNGETYLKQAIDSILNQTYKNIEIILWDNQSTDNSAFIIQQYSDSRLKYFYSDNHTNLYEARDMAIKKAKGRYIAFLDVDDIWVATKVEKQVNLLESTGESVCYSNYFSLKGSRKWITFKKKLPSGYISSQLLKSYDIGILTLLMKREVYENPQIFNKSYNVIGDFDFMIRLSCNYKILVDQTPLAYYRLHDRNYSRININEMKMEFLDWVNNKNQVDQIKLDKNIKYIKNKIIYLDLQYSISNENIVKNLRSWKKLNEISTKSLYYLLLILLRYRKKRQNE